MSVFFLPSILVSNNKIINSIFHNMAKIELIMIN